MDRLFGWPRELNAVAAANVRIERTAQKMLVEATSTKRVSDGPSRKRSA